MLKIIHAADFHLDSPFSGLSPEQAALRRAEQRALLDRIADLANEEQADLVLLAGDLLDSGQLYRETAQSLANTLGRIRARVFIAPGNHDPYCVGSPYTLPIWPENVHIFSSPQPAGVELPELGCTVYGAAFLQEQTDAAPLDGFCAPDDGRIHLMVLHANTEGAGYAPISPAQIAATGLDYLALGHIHQTSGLMKNGRTFWAYPGCPEGRGFDELGEKGVLVLEVDRDTVSSRFVPLCRRRYAIVSVALSGCSQPLAPIEAALPAGTGQDIYRILLTGEFPMDPATLADLEQALSPRFWALELRDKTRTPTDLWARAAEDSLAGLFLQIMQPLCRQSPDDEHLQLAVRYGLAALENGEDVAP